MSLVLLKKDFRSSGLKLIVKKKDFTIDLATILLEPYNLQNKSKKERLVFIANLFSFLMLNESAAHKYADYVYEMSEENPDILDEQILNLVLDFGEYVYSLSKSEEEKHVSDFLIYIDFLLSEKSIADNVGISAQVVNSIRYFYCAAQFDIVTKHRGLFNLAYLTNIVFIY